MFRRKRKFKNQKVELDITAFLNLMIVLVPVLLLSMVFAHTAVLDLNFPTIDENKLNLDDDKLQLQLIVRANGIRLADSKAGLIRRIDKLDGQYDFPRLSLLLRQVKAKLPDRTDITILLEQDIEYQTLVSVMDTTRSYPAVVAASLVEAELFPDISIGDAPEISNANSKVAK